MADHFYGLGVQIDEQEFAFNTGLSFRGLTLSLHAEGWNIIVRAHDERGACYYTMIQHEDIGRGIAILMDMHRARGGKDLWRHDKYA